MDTTIVVLVAAVSAIITQIEVLFQAARGGDELAKLEKLNADGTLNDVGMAGLQVRKTLSWPRSWANFSLF